MSRIGAKLAETVRIDTTHFVCTEGRGQQWERAVEMNIPVVRPEWLEGCEREGRIVSVRGYYLNADPRLRQIGQGGGGVSQPQSPPQLQQQQREEFNERRQGIPDRTSSITTATITGRKENQRPPPFEQYDHARSGSPDTENPGTNADADGTDEAASNPPTPPIKDDAGPEQKTIGEEELKSRLEDRDQLGKKASGTQSMNGNRMVEQGVEDDGRSAGDGESFSEVAL